MGLSAATYMTRTSNLMTIGTGSEGYQMKVTGEKNSNNDNLFLDRD